MGSFTFLSMVLAQDLKTGVYSPNKRFKRDCQRMAFSVLGSICGCGCLVKPSGSVASPLSGRYA